MRADLMVYLIASGESTPVFGELYARFAACTDNLA